MLRPPLIAVPLTGLLVVFAGCQAPTPASSPRPPVGSSQRALTQQGRLVFVDVGELLAADTTALADLDRYRVDRTVAQRWARAYARAKGAASVGDLCLALPLVDREGTPGGHFFLFGVGPCDYASAKKAARSIWKALGVSDAAQPETRVFAQALATSGERFFTVVVAAHSFRHPLVEAQRGLPGWLLRASTGGKADPGPSCEPTALLAPEPARGHFELLRYLCAGKTKLFSHTRLAEVAERSLSTLESPLVAFRRLRRNLLHKYGRGGIGVALERNRQVWQRYLAQGARR